MQDVLDYVIKIKGSRNHQWRFKLIYVTFFRRVIFMSTTGQMTMTNTD